MAMGMDQEVIVQAEDVIARLTQEVAALTRRAVVAEAARDQLLQELTELKKEEAPDDDV